MMLYPCVPKPPARNTVYVGTRGLHGAVYVTADGFWLDPRPSQKVWNHSPDGFEWGYCGSGPAQLALAILLHASDGNKELALDLYQEFKRQVVAGWANAQWSITRAGVLKWIGEQPWDEGLRGAMAEGGGL